MIIIVSQGSWTLFKWLHNSIFKIRESFAILSEVSYRTQDLKTTTELSPKQSLIRPDLLDGNRLARVYSQ